MGSERKIDDLELRERLDFQDRLWRVQRAGWVLGVLVVIGTIAGVFGRGPISYTTRGEPGSALWIEFDYFARLQAAATLTAHVNTAVVQGPDVELWIDGQYLRTMHVTRIIPQPNDTRMQGDWIVHTFADPQTDEFIVQLDITPADFGTVEGAVRLRDSEPIYFDQFIYP